jgi:cysteine sulfinate desulfinase/cysteine desulfurase-like protein
MGVDGGGALRISLGWSTTEVEIDRTLDILVDVVKRLRS